MNPRVTKHLLRVALMAAAACILNGCGKSPVAPAPPPPAVSSETQPPSPPVVSRSTQTQADSGSVTP